MGIGVLRSGIGLDGSECPGELSDIHVLSSFDFEQYEQFVTELFESHRKYLEGSRDDKGDIETEHEMITQSITDLCNIMDMPTAPKRGSKRKDKLEPSLSIKKLRILLDKHSLKQTSKFVLDFVKHVQELVSQAIGRLHEFIDVILRIIPQTTVCNYYLFQLKQCTVTHFPSFSPFRFYRSRFSTSLTRAIKPRPSHRTCEALYVLEQLEHNLNSY